MPRRIGWHIRENAPWPGAPRGLEPRGDVWLAGRGELEALRGALERLLGGGAAGPVRRVLQGNVLLHRIPSQYREFAVEVWGHGLRLGSAEILPGGEWTFYPSGALASLLVGAGLEPVRVAARGRLKGKRVRLDSCGPELVIVSQGRHVGPARRLRGCTYRVRDMAPRGFRLLPSTGRREAVEANRAHIERLAAEAREFIRAHAGEARVHVAVSGGADSSAAAVLAVQALGPDRVTLVYADTGMEPPENRRTVERLASWLGARLDIVESPVDPLEEIRRRGLMTRDNRWCTRILKLAPLARYYRRTGARIVVDGARMLESQNRARLPRSGVNPLIPFVRRILPIHSWTRLEVQLLLWKEGAPVNPLYEEGFTRLGCMVCPAMSLHELRLASRLYPGFYERLARASGLSVEDLLRGGWRRSRGARGNGFI